MRLLPGSLSTGKHFSARSITRLEKELPTALHPPFTSHVPCGPHLTPDVRPDLERSTLNGLRATKPVTAGSGLTQLRSTPWAPPKDHAQRPGTLQTAASSQLKIESGPFPSHPPTHPVPASTS